MSARDLYCVCNLLTSALEWSREIIKMETLELDWKAVFEDTTFALEEIEHGYDLKGACTHTSQAQTTEKTFLVGSNLVVAANCHTTLFTTY